MNSGGGGGGEGSGIALLAPASSRGLDSGCLGVDLGSQFCEFYMGGYIRS